MREQNSCLREHALAIWRAGIDAALPARLVGSALRVRGRKLHVGALCLPLASIKSIAVVGAGKAGAAMSRAVEQALGARLIEEKRLHGWVNVPAQTVIPLKRVQLHGARTASDNQPTAAGVEGARRIREIVASLGQSDLAICLLSGGGSSLLPAPVSGVSLADKQAITAMLHSSGATIGEMNAVRKHLSELKGGGLARSFRGRWLVSLIISDVVGDPLDVIASGPTSSDPTTFQDALAVLEKYRLRDRAPAPVREYLKAGAAGSRPETLKRLPRNVTNYLIGNNATALRGAARQARQLGYRVINLSSFIEGESQQVGIVLAGLARGVREQHQPLAPPACLISGGETTVALGPEHGTGGRNQELVLAALHHLGPGALRDVVILSGGTDGEDGPTDAAGAVGDAGVLARARQRNLDPADYLNRHDSYHFFEPLGGLIKTGLTNTNVTDLRVILVGPPPP